MQALCATPAVAVQPHSQHLSLVCFWQAVIEAGPHSNAPADF